jgi:hypothetical protein
MTLQVTASNGVTVLIVRVSTWKREFVVGAQCVENAQLYHSGAANVEELSG